MRFGTSTSGTASNPDTGSDISAASAHQPDRRAASVGLIVLCQSMQALVLGGLALFLPLIRKDVSLTFAQAGSLGAASTLVYALMQIPSGYLADRVGPKRLFLVGLLGTNLLAFTFAQLHTYRWLLLNQAASGFFRALVFAPGLLLMVSLFPPHRRASAMGLYVAGGFSSSVFLNLLGPVVVGPLGWRRLFELFAVAGALLVFIYWKVGAAPAQAAAAPLPPRRVIELFRFRAGWLLATIQYVRLAVAFGLAFWLPTYLVDDRGHTLRWAGAVVALAAALTAVSNFLGGYLSDRLGNPALVIAGSQAVLAVTIVLLVHVHHSVLLVALIAVNALFVQLYFGPLFSLGIELLGSRNAGVASGFGNFFANLGAFSFAYSFGVIKDSTGSFAVGFYSLAGLCVVALACTLALERMTPTGPGGPS